MQFHHKVSCTLEADTDTHALIFFYIIIIYKIFVLTYLLCIDGSHIDHRMVQISP